MASSSNRCRGKNSTVTVDQQKALDKDHKPMCFIWWQILWNGGYWHNTNNAM